VDWDMLGPRTYTHPRDGSGAHNGAGVIPVYENGGYDACFVGLSGDIDYDPTVSYSNVLFSPTSVNFASYDNQTISDLIAQYTSTLDVASRNSLAKQIQAMAYQDQPYINVVNTGNLYAYDSEMSGLTVNDLLMISTSNYRDGYQNLDHLSKSKIVYAHPFGLGEFNPFVRVAYASSLYINPIFPGLYERDPADSNYAFRPVIAKSMPVWNPTNTSALIEINTNAQFSNGKNVTVDDVVNSFHMHMSPAWSTFRYADLVSHIASNTSVFKEDSTHLNITLKDPYFLANKLFSVEIFDQNEIGTPLAPLGDNGGTDFNTNAWKFHGTGPFMYNESRADHGIDLGGNTIHLSKVPNYWNGEVKLDSIEFRRYDTKWAALGALVNGDVQIADSSFIIIPEDIDPPTTTTTAVTSSITTSATVTDVSYEIFPDFGTQMLSINMDHPILGTGIDTPLGQANPARAEEAARYVRQAISHAIQRDYIVSNILYGVGSKGTTLWPAVSVGYDSSLVPHPYDLEMAKSLLSKAGYTIITRSYIYETTTDTVVTMIPQTEITTETDTITHYTSTDTLVATETTTDITTITHYTSTDTMIATETETVTSTINKTETSGVAPASFTPQLVLIPLSFMIIIHLRKRKTKIE
jgi:ABC-type transport system substrate-binding protein